MKRLFLEPSLKTPERFQPFLFFELEAKKHKMQCEGLKKHSESIRAINSDSLGINYKRLFAVVCPLDSKPVW